MNTLRGFIPGNPDSTKAVFLRNMPDYVGVGNCAFWILKFILHTSNAELKRRQCLCNLWIEAIIKYKERLIL